MANAKSAGPWELFGDLGSGGNATVYRARRGDGAEVALKVLDHSRVEGERYRRFVQEIKFLRSLGPFAGVLPILDAYLPDLPSKSDRPWLAMPIATPIATALQGATLELVVAALTEIADALARLAARGVGHRDVKPGNLYEREGTWLIGDFGLVAAPEADDDITRAGKALGPAHFVAYEMVLNAETADPLPADVFSFGKTLWSLATGVPYPPLGHQPADTRTWSIRDFRIDPRVGALDQLVDRTTQLTPSSRPTMAEIVRDLRAWTQLATKAPALDIGNLRQKIVAKMERELSAEDLLAERKRLTLAHVRRLQELCRPLDAGLKELHPRAELDAIADKLTRTMLTTNVYAGERVEWSFLRVSKIVSNADARRYALAYGRGIELMGDGSVTVRAYILVHFEEVLGVDFVWHPPGMSGPVGSIEADRVIERTVSDLALQLEQALAVFVENVPELR